MVATASTELVKRKADAAAALLESDKVAPVREEVLLAVAADRQAAADRGERVRAKCALFLGCLPLTQSLFQP